MTIPATKVVTATIANGQTVGVAFSLEGYRIAGLIFPTMTGTAMTFQVCDTVGGTYRAAKQSSDGADVSIVIATNTCAIIPQGSTDDLGRVPHVKLVSGSAEGAARSIKVLLERV